MQYIIRAYDGENMLNKRMEVRPRHLENMAKVNGKVICAGGLLDEEGNEPTFLRGDRYKRAVPLFTQISNQSVLEVMVVRLFHKNNMRSAFDNFQR